MNSAQRLLRSSVVALVLLLVAFPPYVIREDVNGARWIAFGPIWQPPYPEKANALPSQPYCAEGHPEIFLVLVEIGAVWMVTSFLYERFGRQAFDRAKYPEYYRP